ncbi:hypothetical protein L4D00_11755 [Photobacterium swingsii]|uniref:hypothetical protein n=1 Tax=Photobacterium swingsii TaxID=680026 RepID=UPI003D0BF33C
MAKTDSNGFPARNTANPTIGGQRCECGDVRTVHQARGKRANFLYSVCDNCGTDQRTGDPVQTKFKAHYPSMAALLAAEQATNQSDPVTLPEGIEANGNHQEPESIAQETPPALQKPSGESSDSEATTTTATSRKPNQTETESQTEKPAFWAIVRGVVLGAICGGVISRI